MNTPRISPHEPVSQLRRIRIVENGEELIDFLEHCPGLLLDRSHFRYRRETLLRRSVAERLCQAEQALPAGVRLAVIEGWRPPHIQRRMYLFTWLRFKEQHPDWSDVTLRRVVNRFSAPLDPRVPPPHTTGGALDVMLADAEGNLLDHTSPFDPWDPKCAALEAAGLSATARRTREILATALRSTGLTNYPSEFWHWSYGDQGWAYRGGHPHAIYRAIEPAGYLPNPDEDIDAPLELVESD
jgi:D-alanyl-D-alanine dipeptidase